MDFYFDLYVKEVNKKHVKIEADNFAEAAARAAQDDYDERIDVEFDVDMPKIDKRDNVLAKEFGYELGDGKDFLVEVDECYLPDLYPCTLYCRDKQFHLKDSDALQGAASHFGYNLNYLITFLSTYRRKQSVPISKDGEKYLAESNIIYQKIQPSTTACAVQNAKQEITNSIVK